MITIHNCSKAVPITLFDELKMMMKDGKPASLHEFLKDESDCKENVEEEVTCLLHHDSLQVQSLKTTKIITPTKSIHTIDLACRCHHINRVDDHYQPMSDEEKDVRSMFMTLQSKLTDRCPVYIMPYSYAEEKYAPKLQFVKYADMKWFLRQIPDVPFEVTYEKEDSCGHKTIGHWSSLEWYLKLLNDYRKHARYVSIPITWMDRVIEAMR